MTILWHVRPQTDITFPEEHHMPCLSACMPACKNRGVKVTPEGL